MATLAHAAYCFACLDAAFDKREPTSLHDIDSQWRSYCDQTGHDDDNMPADALDDAAQTPLFVTWNIYKNGRHSLRGCIGTFEPQPLKTGLRDYASIAAFQDTRFSPIQSKDLPSLQVCVTLLTNFEAPVSDPLDWEIGLHGLRIKFLDNGRIRGATYLPDVAKEQGWTKEEAVISLMRKAGWDGDERRWRNVEAFELIRYKGKKVSLDYDDYKKFQDWVAEQD